MPSLARHPFGLHYIYLRLFVGLIRSLSTLVQWFSRKQQVHDGVDGVKFRSITVPSRDKGRNIKVHLYQPEHYTSTKPTPVLINWHGSVRLADTAASKAY